MSNRHPSSPSETQRLARAEQIQKLGEAGVAELLAGLVDPSWQVRRAVIAGLAAQASAVEPLRDLLRDRREDETQVAASVDALVASVADVESVITPLATSTNPAVVADVAQILGRRRNLRAIPLLTQLTEHEDDNVAVAAIEALGRIGGRSAIDALVRCAESNLFFRVFPAVDVLGRSGDPRAIEPLSRLLSQPRYVPEAARALGRTGDPRATEPLAALLTSASASTTRVAALSLFELCARQRELYGTSLAVEETLRSVARPNTVRKLASSMSGADSAERVAICAVLGALQDPTSLPLLLSLVDAAPEVARAAADALTQLGQVSKEALSEALLSGDSLRRRALLPVVRHSSASEAVAACLADPDQAVRALACHKLAQLGDKAALPALFERLDDTSAQVVHAASGAIQSLGDSRVTELALEATHSSAPAIRRAAARILGSFGDEAIVPRLRDLSSDSDAQVRDAAIMALALIESEPAEALLRSLCGRDDPRIRATAMRALGQQARSASGIDCLLSGLSDADSWVRYYAAQGLGKLGEERATSALIACLDDDHGQVPVAAIEALSHLKNADALSALRAASSSDNPDKQRAAFLGLSLAGDVASLPSILQACVTSDPATRLIALSASTAFHTPAVVETLRRAAGDPSDVIRTAAIGFLAARPEPEATRGLIALLAKSENPAAVIAALANPGEGRVAGILQEAALADERLAPTLSSILARLHQPEATAGLYDLLSSPNVNSRRAAVATLSAIGGQAVSSALTKLAASDPDPTVRNLCALFLTQ